VDSAGQEHGFKFDVSTSVSPIGSILAEFHQLASATTAVQRRLGFGRNVSSAPAPAVASRGLAGIVSTQEVRHHQRAGCAIHGVHPMGLNNKNFWSPVTTTKIGGFVWSLHPSSATEFNCASAVNTLPTAISDKWAWSQEVAALWVTMAPG